MQYTHLKQTYHSPRSRGWEAEHASSPQKLHRHVQYSQGEYCGADVLEELVPDEVLEVQDRLFVRLFILLNGFYCSHRRFGRHLIRYHPGRRKSTPTIRAERAQGSRSTLRNSRMRRDTRQWLRNAIIMGFVSVRSLSFSPVQKNP